MDTVVRVAVPVGAAAAAGTVAVVAAPAVLAAVGFGSGGVVAGTVASAAQSTFYGALTTGLFSSLQSAGAVGIGMASKAVVWGVTSGAVGAAEAAGYVSLSRFFK